MTTLQVQVPDPLLKTLKGIVQAGQFHDEAEIVQEALIDYLRRHQHQLQEQFQREDLDWFRQLKETG